MRRVAPRNAYRGELVDVFVDATLSQVWSKNHLIKAVARLRSGPVRKIRADGLSGWLASLWSVVSVLRASVTEPFGRFAQPHDVLSLPLAAPLPVLPFRSVLALPPMERGVGLEDCALERIERVDDLRYTSTCPGRPPPSHRVLDWGPDVEEAAPLVAGASPLEKPRPRKEGRGRP